MGHLSIVLSFLLLNSILLEAWIYHNLFYPFNGGQALGLFVVFGIRDFVGTCVLILTGRLPGVELLGFMVKICLMF